MFGICYGPLIWLVVRVLAVEDYLVVYGEVGEHAVAEEIAAAIAHCVATPEFLVLAMTAGFAC